MAAPAVVGVGAAAASAGSGTINVPYPTVGGGILANDLLLIFCGDRTNSSITTPAGYTDAYTLDTNGLTHETVIFWTLAAGGETGNVGVARTGTNACIYVAMAVRGVATTTPLHVVGGRSKGSITANLTFLTGLTTTVADCLIVAAGFKSDDWSAGASPMGTHSGLTFTEQIDSITTLGSDFGVVVDTAPATGTVVVGTTGTIALGGTSPTAAYTAVYLAVAPPAAAAASSVFPRRPERGLVMRGRR